MSTALAKNGLSLLLIDDDVELCSMMQEYFAQAGHQLSCAHRGDTGLQMALEEKPDLVLLDVMLPGMDGITILQQLRERKGPPIILLTARVERQDRIRGLDTGADDYITKPFDADELLARIRAVLRRSGGAANGDDLRHQAAGVDLDVRGRMASLDGKVLDLTGLEFDILELLMRSANQVVPRDMITTELLERRPSPYDRALDVHVSRLRLKLGSKRDLIRTVRGSGYIFSPPGAIR